MSSRGFTLIEVAAALVVLVLLVVPMLAARNRTVSAAIETSNKFVAAQLAASKLGEVAAIPLEEIDRYGTFEEAPHYEWRFSVDPQDDRDPPCLYRMTLVISFPSPAEEDGTGELAVSTLVLSSGDSREQ